MAQIVGILAHTFVAGNLASIKSFKDRLASFDLNSGLTADFAAKGHTAPGSSITGSRHIEWAVTESVAAGGHRRIRSVRSLLAANTVESEVKL